MQYSKENGIKWKYNKENGIKWKKLTLTEWNIVEINM